jgi:MFS family permease
VTILLLTVYFVCIMGDSAALTAGLVAAAPPNQRGAAMAVYSFMGFGAGIAPLVFGAVLDVAGGKADASAWGSPSAASAPAASSPRSRHASAASHIA